MEDTSARGDLVEIDLKGQICPATLLRSLREINARQQALRAGRSRLAILVDNRYSLDTISDVARSMGYRVTVTGEAAHYRILVEAGE